MLCTPTTRYSGTKPLSNFCIGEASKLDPTPASSLRTVYTMWPQHSGNTWKISRFSPVLNYWLTQSHKGMQIHFWRRYGTHAQLCSLANHHPFLEKEIFLHGVIWAVPEQNSFSQVSWTWRRCPCVCIWSWYAGIHRALGPSQYFILIYTERRNNWKLPSIHT